MVKKIKKRWWWLAIIIIGIAALFFWFKSQAPVTEYTTVEVKLGTLIQTVSETGTVKPVKRLDLNFPQSGLISQILVKVGETVAKGQVLGELDQSTLNIRAQEAEASLAGALANQQKLISGATASELAVLEAQVRQARSAYEGAVSDYDKTRQSTAENVSQAQKKLSDLNDETSATPTALEQAVAIAKLNLSSGQANYLQALTNSENVFTNAAEYNLAVANTALDKIKGLLDDESLDDVFSVRNTSYRTLTQVYYNEARELREAADSALKAAKSERTEANYNNLHTRLSSYLNKIFSNLNAAYSGLENTVTSSGFPQSSLDAYKTSINAQISAINSSISSQQTAKYNLDNSFLSYKNNTASLSEALRQAEIALTEGRLAAENALSSAQLAADKQVAAAKAVMDNSKESWGVADRQLAKLKSGARSEDINLAAAQVRQAQASLDLITKQREDSQLVAPLAGQVIGINYEAGEQFSAAKPFLTMLTEDNYEIDVDISETDITKVKVGDEATISFDALGESRQFSGSVYSIEPSATVIQGVIYYKAKIVLAATEANSDSQLIKPEMTANVVIKTAAKDDVIIIPNRAVIDRNGQGKFVRILDNGLLREVPVTLGLSGDDGLVEVVDGELVPGQLAVTFVKEAGK